MILLSHVELHRQGHAAHVPGPLLCYCTCTSTVNRVTEQHQQLHYTSCSPQLIEIFQLHTVLALCYSFLCVASGTNGLLPTDFLRVVAATYMATTTKPLCYIPTDFPNVLGGHTAHTNTILTSLCHLPTETCAHCNASLTQRHCIRFKAEERSRS